MTAGASAEYEAQRSLLDADAYERLAADSRARARRYVIAARTERSVGRCLAALEKLDWRVLADRRWAGSKRANVDFLLVGQLKFEIPNILLKPEGRSSSFVPDYSRMQTRGTGVPAPSVDLSFEAISSTTSGCGCLPPDTNGDVSDTHFIQWVNSSWQAFDKVTGAPDPNTLSPRPGNSFFVFNY